MIYEAFLSGIWAAVGSTLGKLAGTESIVGESYLIWSSLLVSMVVANTWGCRHYLRSLDAAANSVTPTVVSAASSYVLSGIIGILVFAQGIIGIVVFAEGSSLRWWIGALLITVGLALVANAKAKLKDD